MSQIANLTIEVGKLEEVVQLSLQIPEFKNPYDITEYRKRLSGKPSLVTIAKIEGKPVGFKLGYQKEDDGSFYSWMGAILPDYRKIGIAKTLAVFQEKWAKEQGYNRIKMKTRNRLKPMLLFALKNDFYITEVQPRDTWGEARISLQKDI